MQKRQQLRGLNQFPEMLIDIAHLQKMYKVAECKFLTSCDYMAVQTKLYGTSTPAEYTVRIPAKA